MSETNHAVESVSDAARKRQLIALALVVAVAIVAAIGYFGFIKGGKSSDTGALPPIPHKSHAASASPSASVAASGAAGVVPAVYQAPPGNNPFKPLVNPPAPTAASTNQASPSVTPTPSVVVPTPTPTVKPSPNPTVTVTPTPTPTGLPTAGEAITLTVVNVDGTAGTVDVTVKKGTTTTPYNGLKPGQVFGTYFKLVSILSSDPATPPVSYGADFQYGDQFVQLAKGDSSTFG